MTRLLKNGQRQKTALGIIKKGYSNFAEGYVHDLLKQNFFNYFKSMQRGCDLIAIGCKTSTLKLSRNCELWLHVSFQISCFVLYIRRCTFCFVFFSFCINFDLTYFLEILVSWFLKYYLIY